MARQSPCMSCPLYRSTPVKLHTQKGAIRAMLAGRVLKREGNRTCYFDKDGFFFTVSGGFRTPPIDFSGLWEEL